MAERDIFLLGNPRLWLVSEPVREFGSSALRELITDLDDTLSGFRRVHGFGRGIAAPQIDVLKRVLFIRMEPPGFHGPLINPSIAWQSDETTEIWDNCFSFPSLSVQVRRFNQIRVNYQDASGVSQVLDASGDLSELLQHEIDHLEGILATDRALSPRAFRMRRE
ncbi:MAG TPA: peptide deformylase [Candidatus Acidoferrum sp.]|nr:peptide deformylase [Candidatus Acidoferrum sp.]